MLFVDNTSTFASNNECAKVCNERSKELNKLYYCLCAKLSINLKKNFFLLENNIKL